MMTQAYKVTYEGDNVLYVYTRHRSRAREIADSIREREDLYPDCDFVSSTSGNDKIAIPICDWGPGDKEGYVKKIKDRSVAAIAADLTIRLNNSDYTPEGHGISHFVKSKAGRSIEEILGERCKSITVTAAAGSNEGHYVEVHGSGACDDSGMFRSITFYLVKMLTGPEDAADLAAFFQRCFDEGF